MTTARMDLRARLGRLWSRYGALAAVACLVGAGVLAALLVQPAPRTFATGWSSPRAIAEVGSQYPQRGVIDRQGRIHLVWQSSVNRRTVAWYARLDRHGGLQGEPVALSDLSANAENAAIALGDDDAPLCFWLEKPQEGGGQRLMMARPENQSPAWTISTSSGIMRDLTLASGAAPGDGTRILLAWSDNRRGTFDIYLTVLDGEGEGIVTDRAITDSGGDFVFQPALAVGGEVVHLVYFSDRIIEQELVHQAYDIGGERLTLPLALETVSQSATSLGGQGAAGSYPLLADVDAKGRLRLYEVLGPAVRVREIDRQGRVVRSPELLLAGGQHYAGFSLARQGERQWLIWAELADAAGQRFQAYAAPLDAAGQPGEVVRLTYAASSVLWPWMGLDPEGGQHVTWQQNAGEYAYRLMYINNLDPSRISAWQRLGFSGELGGWSMAMALAEGAVLAVPTVALNAWRLAIAWAAAVLALWAAGRLAAVRPYARIAAWAGLLAALCVAVRPEVKTLGQMPIPIAPAVHWVMAAAASAVVLYLGRVWREGLERPWAWVSLGGIWLGVYYWINLVLILRAGFAV